MKRVSHRVGITMESKTNFKWIWLWGLPILLFLLTALWLNEIIPLIAILLISLSLLIACLMVSVTFALIESNRDSKAEWYGLFALSSIGVTLVNILFLIIAYTYRQYHIIYSPALITWFILVLSAWSYSKRGLLNQENGKLGDD